MQTPLVFVGIDVSKAWLDVGLRPSDEQTRVPYDAHGITTLIAQLTPVRPTRIVIEATGGLERLLLRALVDAALPVIVVIRARSGTLPRRRGSWPRRTRSMRRCWPALRRSSSRPCE